MRRGTIVLLFFGLVALGIIGVNTLLQNQPPVTVTVAVSPLIREWAEATAADFNASNTLVGAGQRAEVTITTIDEVRVWRDREWTAQNHPDAWIPAMAASVEYARTAAVPLALVEEETARTLLLWGGYTSRTNVLTDSAALTWATVANATATSSWEALGGESSWRFVDLAFSLPDQTVTGLAVLLSGAANFNQTTTLNGAALQNSQFRDWMTPVLRSVPNFTNVGNDAAEFLARRGIGGADIAIAPESQWLGQLPTFTQGNEPLRFSYPEYALVFEFPLVRWDASDVTDIEIQTIAAFGAWLTADAQQATLPAYGLRPITGNVTVADALFAQGEPLGIVYEPNFDNRIQPPRISTESQALLRWAETVLR